MATYRWMIGLKNFNCLKTPIWNVRWTSTLQGKTSEELITENREDSVINFKDSAAVYKHKTTLDLLRALCVLKICSYGYMVDNSEQLMKLGTRLLGGRLMSSLMKPTFFRQFVVENRCEDITTCVASLRQAGIGTLLCVPMEEDVEESCGADSHYNGNMTTILNCINMAAEVQQTYPMTQMKLTSILPAKLCYELSRLIPEPHEDPDAVKSIADAMKTGRKVSMSMLSEHGTEQLERGLNRIKQIGEVAVARNVIVMVDAEYTCINPALNLLTLAMMLNYNVNTPLVFYTYQNYLKATYERMRQDMMLTDSCGVGFGAKVVRGAYMERERRLAHERGYPDPVNDTFDATTAMYNDSMDLLLSQISRNPGKVKFMLGSHNVDTMERALSRMEWYDIPPHDGNVFLGQIYGLSDHLSLLLGNRGYPVYKSVPLGTLEDTIPYLSRRAQENKAILQGVKLEKKLLKQAISNRMTSGGNAHTMEHS